MCLLAFCWAADAELAHSDSSAPVSSSALRSYTPTSKCTWKASYIYPTNVNRTKIWVTLKLDIHPTLLNCKCAPWHNYSPCNFSPRQYLRIFILPKFNMWALKPSDLYVGAQSSSYKIPMWRATSFSSPSCPCCHASEFTFFSVIKPVEGSVGKGCSSQHRFIMPV